MGALLSHWRRHPLQALTLIVGLALATGLWTGVQAINAQARTSYDWAAAQLGQDSLERIVHPGRDLALADFAAFRRAGWPVTPVLEGRVRGTRVIGIDPFTAPPGEGVPDLSGADDLTAFLTGELAFGGAGAALPIAVRRLDGVAPGTAVADIAAVQRLLGTARIDRLLLLPGVEGDPASVVPGTAREAPPAEGDLDRLTDSFHLNLTAFGLLAFAVGLFIVNAAIGLAFEQRRPLFRTLRAIGLSARALTALLAGELLILTLVAGLIGCALGYLVAAALLPGVAATLGGLYGAPVDGGLTLAPAWWLTGLGMAVAGAALAGGQSLWQLARLPVLAPAMPRAWARARAATLRRQGAGGVALLAAAALLGAFGQGLGAGFALLGALLLGAALLLPPLLVAALDGLSRLVRGPVAEWMVADARQQVPGLSLALMALLLALAANVGVGTMVGSFRETFTGWLDQRLAAQLYVTGADEAQAREIAAFVGDRADVLPIVSVQTDVAGAPGELFGQPDHPIFRDEWPLLDAVAAPWDRLHAGEGALLNEQTARRMDLWAGDAVDLGGTAWEVLGVYSDYGNPRGQAILGLGAFDAAYPEADRRRLALVTGDAALRDDLEARFGLPPDRLVDQAGIKRFSLDVFEQTFAVTRALNVLTLGVAGFALWASLTTLGTMRLPQVAPVWALGLTRRAIALSDLARATLLAALTAALAVPVGLALAWVLLAVVNVAAFGWRLPMLVYPGQWLELALWALLAAALAALVPAWRLWRMAPARLVGVFAGER
nr:ABC transporter permease [Jannaschia sp. Os4]